jgi:Spy/CpxP family protein refolding chaperone
MKNTNNLQRFLLAAVLALPLAAMADSAGDEAPDGAPHGPRPDRRGPGPAIHADDHDGPRGDAPGHGAGRGPGPDSGPGFGPGFDGVPPYLRGIELSEAQQDKVFTIVHGQVPYLREQGKARDKADRALFALHRAAKYDDAAAVKLAQAAAQADANITLSHLRTEQKVLAVLTAEQRKSLDERRDGRPPRGEPGREGGPGAGRPDTQ